MTVLSIVIPLILPGLLGFFLVKKVWITLFQLTLLRRIVFNIAIPLLVIQSFAKLDLTQANPIIYLSYYLPVFIIYLLAYSCNYIFHQRLKGKTDASATFALGACYSNNVVVGLPIALMVNGQTALTTVFMIIAIHSPILFTLTSILNAKEQKFNWAQLTKQTLYNPLILAIIIGLTINISPFELPILISEAIQASAKSIIISAVFLLGASLATYTIKAEIHFISIAVLLKLITLPSLVFLTSFYVFTLPAPIATTLVFLAASPTAINSYLMARQQKYHQSTVAGTVAMSTLFSIITVPIWLWIVS